MMGRTAEWLRLWEESFIPSHHIEVGWGSVASSSCPFIGICQCRSVRTKWSTLYIPGTDAEQPCMLVFEITSIQCYLNILQYCINIPVSKVHLQARVCYLFVFHSTTYRFLLPPCLKSPPTRGHTTPPLICTVIWGWSSSMKHEYQLWDVIYCLVISRYQLVVMLCYLLIYWCQWFRFTLFINHFLSPKLSPPSLCICLISMRVWYCITGEIVTQYQQLSLVNTTFYALISLSDPQAHNANKLMFSVCSMPHTS